MITFNFIVVSFMLALSKRDGKEAGGVFQGEPRGSVGKRFGRPVERKIALCRARGPRVLVPTPDPNGLRPQGPQDPNGQARQGYLSGSFVEASRQAF